MLEWLREVLDMIGSVLWKLLVSCSVQRRMKIDDCPSLPLDSLVKIVLQICRVRH